MKANYEEDKVIVSATEPTGIDRKKVWIKKGKNKFNANELFLNQTNHVTNNNSTNKLSITTNGNYGYSRYKLTIPKEYLNKEVSISFNGVSTINGSQDGVRNTIYISSTQGESGDIMTQLLTTTKIKYSVKFTPTSQEIYITIYGTLSDYSVVMTIEMSEIQLELGETTDYEPYIEKEIYVKNENGAYEKYMFDDVTKINNIITEFYDNTNKKIKSSSVYISNGSNIDNMVESGIYYIMSTFGGTFPSGLGGNGCVVIVATTNINYNAQLAFGFGSDKIAIRRKNGSTTWSEWKYANFN